MATTARLDPVNAARQRAHVDRYNRKGFAMVQGADRKFEVNGTLFNSRDGRELIAFKHAVRRWCVACTDDGSLVTLGSATRSDAMIEAQRKFNGSKP